MLINSRCVIADALAVTIRPPFGWRANAAMARSISDVSRTLIGLTSTPSDGATDWMTANWPIPAGRWVPKDRRSRYVWRDLLEELQPFAAQTVFELHKARRVSTRPRQAIDETGADRVGHEGEDDRHGAGCLKQIRVD